MAEKPPLESEGEQLHALLDELEKLSIKDPDPFSLPMVYDDDSTAHRDCGVDPPILPYFAWRSTIPTTSPGRLDTAQLHLPKPPCSFTAFTHSSKNARLVLSWSVSCPLVSRTKQFPVLSRIMKSGLYLCTTPLKT